MNHAYLITGGNLGDRVANLALAATFIGQMAGQMVRKSGLYQTAAWGKAGQPDFLNQVLEIDTPLDANALLHTVLAIEQKLGRLRQEKYGPRVIDIDILFFNNQIIDNPQLTVPHPHLHNRRFVLVPLAEIAPGYQHPILRQTVSQLLTACSDPLDVKKFSEERAV